MLKIRRNTFPWMQIHGEQLTSAIVANTSNYNTTYKTDRTHISYIAAVLLGMGAWWPLSGIWGLFMFLISILKQYIAVVLKFIYFHVLLLFRKYQNIISGDT